MNLNVANVMQDNMLRQGREITDLEMKSHALSRKKHYESELKSTMLRLRGTFADVILGTKKELQNSINQSFAAQTDDMEMSFTMRLADMEKKLIQKFTKKAIDAEHSFSKQLKERDSTFAKMKADMEFSEAKKTEELQNSFTKLLENQQASAKFEMTNMRNQLSQAEEAVSILHAQMNQIHDELRQERAHSCELDLAKNLAQNQLSQERESFNQRIASIEKSREETVSKLSSTLQTLETTCASSQRLETRLREREAILREMEEQLSLNDERAIALQHKLDNEVKNKRALIDVQTEMEKHLTLERERADLLEQKVEASQEADYQRRGELDRTSQENIHLKKKLDQLSGELDRASRENIHLKNEFDRAGQQFSEQLDRASQDNMTLKNELDRIVGELDRSSQQLDRASQDNMTLKNEIDRIVGELDRSSQQLDRASQDNMVLKNELNRLVGELDQSSQQLNRASQDNMVLKNELDRLVGELDRSSQENKQLKSELERWGEDNMQLKSDNDRFSQHLQIANEVGSTLKNKLTELQAQLEEQAKVSQSSASECLKLKRDCEEFKIKSDNITEINSLLEAKIERLEATIQDQMIDMEAARMSEAEVEKSLAESLQYGRELDNVAQKLDAELKNALSDYERVTEQLGLVSHEKVEIAAAFEELTKELEAVKRRSAEAEHAFNQERNEISGALAGFDTEISNAEEKLSSVLQLNADLEVEVASLRTQLESERDAENMKLGNAQIVIETLQDEVRQLVQTFKEKEDTLKKNMQEEINNLEEQFVKVNDDLNAQMTRYDADIGVYEEAIRMLRNQVDIFQKQAENQCSHCEKCAQTDDDEESRIETSTEGLEAIKDELKDTIKRKLKETIEDDLNETLKRELKEELKQTMKEELKQAMKIELREAMKEEARHELQPSLNHERLAEADIASDMEKENPIITTEYDIRRIEKNSSLEKLEDRSTPLSNISHDSIRDEGVDVIEVVAKATHSSGEMISFINID
jgi:chromosome segregation ATPase